MFLKPPSIPHLRKGVVEFCSVDEITGSAEKELIKWRNIQAATVILSDIV